MMKTSSSIALCCALASVMVATGTFAASVFDEHSLQKRQTPENKGAPEKKQEAEQESSSEGADLTLAERVQLVMTVINQTDPKECYPRLLCEMASKDDGFDHFRYLLDIFGGPMDKDIATMPPHLQEFSAQLRKYIEAGRSVKDVEACRKKYECEFTGEQIEEHTAYLEQQIVALLPDQQSEEVEEEDLTTTTTTAKST